MTSSTKLDSTSQRKIDHDLLGGTSKVHVPLQSALIILAVLGLAFSSIGLASFGAHQQWWSAGTLINLTKFDAIVMISVSGTVGIVSALFCVYFPWQKKVQNGEKTQSDGPVKTTITNHTIEDKHERQPPDLIKASDKKSSDASSESAKEDASDPTISRNHGEPSEAIPAESSQNPRVAENFEALQDKVIPQEKEQRATESIKEKVQQEKSPVIESKSDISLQEQEIPMSILKEEEVTEEVIIQKKGSEPENKNPSVYSSQKLQENKNIIMGRRYEGDITGRSRIPIKTKNSVDHTVENSQAKKKHRQKKITVFSMDESWKELMYKKEETVPTLNNLLDDKSWTIFLQPADGNFTVFLKHPARPGETMSCIQVFMTNVTYDQYESIRQLIENDKELRQYHFIRTTPYQPDDLIIGESELVKILGHKEYTFDLQVNGQYSLYAADKIGCKTVIVDNRTIEVPTLALTKFGKDIPPEDLKEWSLIITESDPSTKKYTFKETSKLPEHLKAEDLRLL